jgi:curved DNA-binding protein CbpA
MGVPQATATGKLGATPIENLLIYVLDRKLSGTLVIEDVEQKRSAVHFEAGAPTKIKLADPEVLLSEVLVSTKRLDSGTAAATFEAARASKQLHGAYLLAEGTIDGDTLEDALAEQIARKIEWICRLGPDTVYGYYDGQNFLRDFGPPEGTVVDPLAVVWRALRAHASSAAVEAALSRFGNREVRLHPRSRVGRMGFDPKERGILDVLRAKPQSIPSLLATGILPEGQMKRILYAMVVTRHLDLGTGVLPVGVEQSASIFPPRASVSPAPGNFTPSQRPQVPSNPPSITPAPRGGSSLPPGPASMRPANHRTDTPPGIAIAAAGAVSPEMQRLHAEIDERTAKLGGANYYEMLGVERDAPVAAIQAAFFQLAKRWHPDRLPADVGDRREAALRIFSRMSEAHQVLSNEEQRKEYERLMHEGGASSDEQEIVQKVLRAATAFQKAEVLFRRGNAEEALKHAQTAAENDPEQAEYIALYAELISQDKERAGDFKEVLKMVNEAKRIQPQNRKVRFYRARILQRAGQAEQAYREFRAIADEDPHNVDAAREVRLYEMRKGKTRSTGPRPSNSTEKSRPGDQRPSQKPRAEGLLDKLFKR